MTLEVSDVFYVLYVILAMHEEKYVLFVKTSFLSKHMYNIYNIIVILFIFQTIRLQRVLWDLESAALRITDIKLYIYIHIHTQYICADTDENQSYFATGFLR